MARWVKSADDLTFVDLDRVDAVNIDNPEWTIYAVLPGGWSSGSKVALTGALSSLDQAKAVVVQLLGVADIQP